ncbi:Diacylglycerol kinase [Rhynchospora pubera]|uniref:Diacylglycerol kinase n=1 Tax=Rhynchospora pubera TaxID=906938 RepID=A0AAV8HIJ3_9POAL|nr:Diacylglycerol kinase [Rhynchospora pubera]
MATSDEASAAAGSTAVAARVSIWESLKGCGIFHKEIAKEELRQKIVMPKYLRVAMRTASTTRDVAAAAAAASSAVVGDEEPMVAPEAPLVVFVNSKSGGRHGPELKERLHELISEEQVFDLQTIQPPAFVEYGLACLEQMASQGDACAKDTREKLRIVVAGGDGTVGWVLGSLTELYESRREPVPPTGIIPLGTGNDLSRTFGWGGSFPFAWRSAVKRLLDKAVVAPICRLDSWHLEVVMPEGEIKEKPYTLKQKNKEMDIEGEMPEKTSCYGGVFYNYLSIGMDAQVAYGFHHLRNEKPYLAQGPVANKLIYAGYSCTQGWFCTPCAATPNLRGLKNILKLFIKRANCSEWEQIPIHSSVRSLVCLNLYNYGSGRHPWGDLKPDYLEKRGFVEAHADDGLLEIFGLKEGWHASFVMAEVIKAKHIAQAAAIKLELRGGQWNRAYLQMDGEPWRQPLTNDYSTFVEIKKMPFHSLMLNGEGS